MIKKKSRTRWIREGDDNTKSFHACLKSHRRTNQITALSRDEVSLVEVNVTKREVKRYLETSIVDSSFKGLSLPVLSSKKSMRDDNYFLTTPFFEEEVWEEVKGCDDDKSSDPDDFNLSFFKEC